jgi:hypothetical protein
MMLSALRQSATLSHETDGRPGDELAAEVLRRGGSLRIKARGGSMLPFLRGGDVVTVAPTPSSAVTIGDVICYESPPGRLLLHRVIRRHDAGFVTKGDALSWTESIDAAAVLGTVVAIEREGRAVRWNSDAARRWNRVIASVSCLIPPLLAVVLPLRRLVRTVARG